jgi:tetratricopeptide (TPR) repeat protein
MGQVAVRICGPSCIDPRNFETDGTNSNVVPPPPEGGGRRKPAKQLKGATAKGGSETPLASHAQDESVQKALVLERLGLAADEAGNNEESEQLFREAIKVREGAHNGDDDALGGACLYTNLGVSLAKQAKFESAIQALKHGRVLHKAANNGSENSQRCGAVIMNLAMALFEQALEIELDSDAASYDAATQFCMEADSCLQTAMKIYADMYGKQHAATERVRQKISMVAQQMNIIIEQKKVTMHLQPWDRPTPELAAKLEQQQERIRAASDARKRWKKEQRKSQLGVAAGTEEPEDETDDEDDGVEEEFTSGEESIDGDWTAGVESAKQNCSPEIQRRGSYHTEVP